MKDNKTTTSGGIGFVGMLQVALIVLKLLGKIDWSWWWVWSPSWISAILGVLVFIVCLIWALGSR